MLVVKDNVKIRLNDDRICLDGRKDKRNNTVVVNSIGFFSKLNRNLENANTLHFGSKTIKIELCIWIEISVSQNRCSASPRKLENDE